MQTNYLFLLCILFTLSACVDSQKDVEKNVLQIKKSAATKIEPLPPPKKITTIDYTAQNMRSPFVIEGGTYTNIPQTVTGAAGQVIKQAPRPDADRPREYLEQFPLSSMAMVGTLSKPDANWGLVKDGYGMIHAVKIGDYMGSNSGVIIAITPSQIKLNETVPNGSGGWMQVRSALNLIQGTTQEAPKTPDKKVPQSPQAPAGKASTPAGQSGGAGIDRAQEALQQRLQQGQPSQTNQQQPGAI
ncbi:MAG TPA: pilus assembly protein PilP [Gammaproteobacteria bacterium]|nr:pilus assembly protein PilP [Gammaproteobacteria bacterium]